MPTLPPDTAADVHAAFTPELLLAAIVDSSEDAILSKAIDGTITSWNRAAERIFGYTAHEMIGQKMDVIVPPESRTLEAEVLARVRAGERVQQYESVRQRKDGSCIDVSLAMSPIRTADGRVIGASTIMRDITREKRSMDAANWLAALVESSDDAIVSKNLNGIITSWNKGAERIFGWRADEIIGRSVLTLIPPDLQHEEAGIIARLKRNERIEHYETTRVRKDGVRISVSLTISPIKNSHGQLVGASKVARDTSEQRRADQAVRLLAAIVDSSDDAIVSKTLDGTITSWNKGAERIFGYTAAEAIGQSISIVFPPDRLDEELKIIDRLKRGDRVDHYRTIRRRKNGELFHASLTISPIRDATGGIIGASKVARDISNEMKALEQLATANAELKRADQMKTEFLAVMSHELRTPLNSIIGFASVLRQDRRGVLDADQKKQLNLIHSSGRHLLNLINDLLDLSRIEAGRIEIEPEEFAPDEAIQEAARTVELLATQKGLQLRYDLGAPEPVYTDRKRLTQVVLNLLSNAIKFTPRGHVVLRTRRDGDQLLVSVTDTGIGIAKESQTALFKPFSQVEGSSRRRFEGTGLGLYLCKKLVGVLGGEITMDSSANRGSTFSFRIPGHAPSAGTDPREAKEPASV